MYNVNAIDSFHTRVYCWLLSVRSHLLRLWFCSKGQIAKRWQRWQLVIIYFPPLKTRDCNFTSSFQEQSYSELFLTWCSYCWNGPRYRQLKEVQYRRPDLITIYFLYIPVPYILDDICIFYLKIRRAHEADLQAWTLSSDSLKSHATINKAINQVI